MTATSTRGSFSSRMATTTSTRDSGLLDVLLPPFEKQHDVRVDVVAVGTGKLLDDGSRGEMQVAKGDRVEAGQVVAYMGSSGQASATHLHFETWHQGEAVDPRTFVAGEPAP